MIIDSSISEFLPRSIGDFELQRNSNPMFASSELEKSIYRREILNAIRGWFSQFLELTGYSESKGIKKAGDVGSHKFYAEDTILSMLESIDKAFAKLSKTDLNKYEYRDLFITPLSYEHGGKMPPHSKHKDGKDCGDLWDIRLNQRKAEFDEERTLDWVMQILKLGVYRLIYTHPRIIEKANKKVPNNAVAISGSGHKDHNA